MTDKKGKLYSFDDLHIGLLRDNGQSLETRDIVRPPSVPSNYWYAMAAQVCLFLNREERHG